MVMVRADLETHSELNVCVRRVRSLRLVNTGLGNVDGAGDNGPIGETSPFTVTPFDE